MIAEGRIAIGGKVVETPATLLASLHGVTVDGNPVKAPAPARLFRYHKPAGLLTTERDPKGRPTIYDRLPAGLPRVMPVGRLDLNTEGLLLLTTDGELKRQLELPASGVERTYRARVFGEISQERLEDLIQGVEIEGIRYGSIDANLERRTGRNAWIELKLTEGKNREVRRVLEHLGLQVSRLLRTSYGPFPLADLPAGAVDEVRQHDLVAFRKGLKGGKPMPVFAPERDEGRSASRHDDQSRGRPQSSRATNPGGGALRSPAEPRKRAYGSPSSRPDERGEGRPAPRGDAQVRDRPQAGRGTNPGGGALRSPGEFRKRASGSPSSRQDERGGGRPAPRGDAQVRDRPQASRGTKPGGQALRSPAEFRKRASGSPSSRQDERGGGRPAPRGDAQSRDRPHGSRETKPGGGALRSPGEPGKRPSGGPPSRRDGPGGTAPGGPKPRPGRGGRSAGKK
jgi:23S rRNA pseudouridine2605 synthase